MTRNTLEQHVVSLELAKQLKEAGYPQDTIYCWWVENGSVYLTLKSNHGRETKSEIYAALLASELGEELPKGFRSGRGDFIYCYLEFNGAVDANGRKHNGSAHEIGDTEADARAKMWLYLKKEGLL